MISLACGIKKQNKQTKQYENRLMDTENKWMVARVEGGGAMHKISEWN